MNDAYARWDRATMDRQYSPSSCLPSLIGYLDEYAMLSDLARRQERVRTDLRYGPTSDEVLDYFPGATSDAPVHVFVHGGNWQELTKDSSAFAAQPLVQQGAAFVAVNYPLAPSVPLDDIVTTIRRCVVWLRAHAEELGFDPHRIHLSGTSAGAHLVAMTLTPGTPEIGNIAGVTLMSGIYDLEPVRHSYVNDALRLDREAAERNSPIRHLPSTPPPVIIARGGNETDEYIRQHGLMAAALRERTRVVEVIADARNHFDLPYDLGVAGTRLGDAVLAQMGLSTEASAITVSTGYAAYAHMDALLSLQHPLTPAATELGFIIMSQVKELLFKLLHAEFAAARDHLRDDQLNDALWTLRRAERIQRFMLSAWEVLAALSPTEFVEFRDILGTASGFQSSSYRCLEFVLGNKNVRMARVHRGSPAYRGVLAALNEPSLYDEALSLLSRRGLGVPPELLARDPALPYETDDKVEHAWREVYLERQRHDDLYRLAEALMDAAELFARWRYTHLVTVQRLLGGKPGTGGTEGFPWLNRISEHRFFPELWTVRTTL